jgi:4-diphosphocytidyl-2-C-methyl-D-erythritol kinase
MEAGLGGGSGNAAHTLLGLNELFDRPLDPNVLRRLGAALGSDVVFFLEERPGLATGRGESVEWLEPFAVLRGCGLLLVHPGFGVSTPWAYGALKRFPHLLSANPGRARQLIHCLRQNDLRSAAAQFFNTLEAPVLEKYPLLSLLQDTLRADGALASLMSGSGSATFALAPNLAHAEQLRDRVLARFGSDLWTAAIAL